METRFFIGWILICLAWEITGFYKAITEKDRAPWWINAISGITSLKVAEYFFILR